MVYMRVSFPNTGFCFVIFIVIRCSRTSWGMRGSCFGRSTRKEHFCPSRSRITNLQCGRRLYVQLQAASNVAYFGVILDKEH